MYAVFITCHFLHSGNRRHNAAICEDRWHHLLLVRNFWCKFGIKQWKGLTSHVFPIIWPQITIIIWHLNTVYFMDNHYSKYLSEACFHVMILLQDFRNIKLAFTHFRNKSMEFTLIHSIFLCCNTNWNTQTLNHFLP